MGLAGPRATLHRHCHRDLTHGNPSWTPSSNYEPNKLPSSRDVAVVWDLNNRPPGTVRPYDAAVKLKTAAFSFGIVKCLVAYGNQHAFSYEQHVTRITKRRRSANRMERSKDATEVIMPRSCDICGRRFYNSERLMNHFNEIHTGEHQKRMNQISSARGKRRVRLIELYELKMQKYRKAANDIATPWKGYVFAHELKRAGFCVRQVSEDKQAVDMKMKNLIAEIIDKMEAGCLVLVSDDDDFVDALAEARLKSVNTVVIGDTMDGQLKRAAEAGFSWQEILMGKARKEATSVLGKWKNKHLLKDLEWTYNPDR